MPADRALNTPSSLRKWMPGKHQQLGNKSKKVEMQNHSGKKRFSIQEEDMLIHHRVGRQFEDKRRGAGTTGNEKPVRLRKWRRVSENRASKTGRGRNQNSLLITIGGYF